MCLYTDTSYYGTVSEDKFVSSQVAQCDLVVYKALDIYDNSKQYGYSPYLYNRYEFGKLKTANNMVTRSKILYNCDYARVNRGLHAFTKKINPSSRFGLESSVLCPAIIPKGSRVFIGTNNEIVSTKLIVYRDIESLEAVHGKISNPIPKSEGLK